MIFDDYKLSSSLQETKSSDLPTIIPDRYEMKYTIPFEMIDPIAGFIAPYCSFDNYSASSPDNFYIVNSLYFDSPEFYFLRQRLERAPNRFNMRIRSYGASPVPPFFAEIKQKAGAFIRKYRFKLEDLNVEETIRQASNCEESKKSNNRLELFKSAVLTYDAEPKVLVQYRRLAFVSNCDDYARVTFDIDLKYQKENSWVPLPEKDTLCNCDLQSAFDPGCCVVLELKCEPQVPLWMVDLVHTFRLKKRGFSKYSNCLRPILGEYNVASNLLRKTFLKYDNI
jgi:hypothetical protein